MRLLCAAHPSCPPELEQAVAQASCLSDVLAVQRPLAYHSDCFVALQLYKPLQLQVAVKSYSKHRLSALTKEQVETELHIHSSLGSLVGAHVVPLLLAAEDERGIHLVVQWANEGELRQHLAGISEQRLREFVVRPLLNALAVLDAKGVVHRDVKPDNVLVHQGQVQLADFGLAVYCHPREEALSSLAQQEEDDAAADHEHERQQKGMEHDGDELLRPSDSSSIASEQQQQPELSSSPAATHALPLSASCNSSMPISCRSSYSHLDSLATPPAAATTNQHSLAAAAATSASTSPSAGAAPVLAMPPHAAASHLQHHHSAPGPQQLATTLPNMSAAAAATTTLVPRSVSTQQLLDAPAGHAPQGQQAPGAAPRQMGRASSAAAPSRPHHARSGSGACLSPVCSLASSAELMSSAGGTPLYTAPEVLKRMFESGAVDQVVTPKNDVWSLGVLVLEALSGTHPFSRCSNTLHAIASHRAFPASAFPPHLSAAALSWLSAATHPDPAQRPSASQLLAHPWLQPCEAPAPLPAHEDQPAAAQVAAEPGAVARVSTRAGGSAGGAGVPAHACKVQLQREGGGGSLGGASPTAASAQYFFEAESWEY